MQALMNHFGWLARRVVEAVQLTDLVQMRPQPRRRARSGVGVKVEVAPVNAIQTSRSRSRKRRDDAPTSTTSARPV